MKLSTIIISLLILTGCAGTAIIFSSSSPEPKCTLKREERIVVEVSGGGGPRETQVTEIHIPHTTSRPPAPPAPPPPLVVASIHEKEMRAAKEKMERQSRTIPKPAKVKPNPEKIVDEIISQLEPANLVFAIDPKKSNISEQISVQMLIDMTKSIDDLKKVVRQSEIITTANIEVSKVVVAKVVAPNFTVVAITPEEQPISSSEITKWEWELIPLKTGKHQIHVTVNAEVKVDGVRKVRSIETFKETVEIEITLMQVMKGWLVKYWQWIISTLILPLGLWLYKRKFNKEKS